MNDTILRRIDEAVIIAALATVPLVVLDARGVMASWLVAANWVVWLVFLVDFAADFARKAQAALRKPAAAAAGLGDDGGRAYSIPCVGSRGFSLGLHAGAWGLQQQRHHRV